MKVRPFRPFVIREAGGPDHRVVSPESILLAENLGIVIVNTPDGSLVILDLSQISSAS